MNNRFLFCSGRGIWRCLYDPHTSLVVSAGFDSAIKVHRLHSPLSALSGEFFKEVEGKKEEIFRLCIPNSLGHSRLMDRYSIQQFCNTLFHFAPLM